MILTEVLKGLDPCDRAPVGAARELQRKQRGPRFGHGIGSMTLDSWFLVPYDHDTISKRVSSGLGWPQEVVRSRHLFSAKACYWLVLHLAFAWQPLRGRVWP